MLIYNQCGAASSKESASAGSPDVLEAGVAVCLHAEHSTSTPHDLIGHNVHVISLWGLGQRFISASSAVCDHRSLAGWGCRWLTTGLRPPFFLSRFCDGFEVFSSKSFVTHHLSHVNQNRVLQSGKWLVKSQVWFDSVLCLVWLPIQTLRLPHCGTFLELSGLPT